MAGHRWRGCAAPARPSRGPPVGAPPPLLCAGAPPAGCAAERSAIWVKQWRPFLWKWRRRRPVQRREEERGIHSPVQRIEGSCDPSYSFPCSDSTRSPILRRGTQCSGVVWPPSLQKFLSRRVWLLREREALKPQFFPRTRRVLQRRVSGESSVRDNVLEMKGNPCLSTD